MNKATLYLLQFEFSIFLCFAIRIYYFILILQILIEIWKIALCRKFIFRSLWMLLTMNW
jgi:hypothetical protein